jgi:tetratricopeptide (TPR) repeat protein
VHHLQEATRLAPGNATAHFNLALLLEDQGFPLVALESFAEAVSYAPDDPEMRLRLADGLRREGRVDEALPHYGRAVALAPETEAAWVGQADALAQLGRFGEALDRLETASRLMPTGGIIAHALARLLAASPAPEIRDGERALELALRVVQARPTVAHVQTVALANAEIGRCDEAAAWQRKAVAAAVEGGDAEYARTLEEAVGHYESGPPCRPPVSDSSP